MTVLSPTPARPRPRQRAGDRVLAGSATGAGVLLLMVLAGVAAFLLSEAWPALTAPATDLPGGRGLTGYLAPLVFGTLLAAAIALVGATLLAVAVALFTTCYAPRRVAGGLSSLVDLLAAVPSVVCGFWGITTLAPALVPSYGWAEQHLGVLPLFAGPASTTGRTMLTAGLVLAVMILPIISAVSREAFARVSALHREAALALGATRWETIRMTVLPYGRSAVVGGAMLRLGRALGETLAIAIVLSASGGISVNLISSSNPSTIAADIALQFPESSGLAVDALVAGGLVLFVLTLVVNVLARWVVDRRADFSGAN